MVEEYNPEKGETSYGANAYFNKNLLGTLGEDSYFTLCPQTISALDILPKLRPDGIPEPNPVGGSSRADGTLFAVLNKCRTLSGQRLLAIWLRNPLKDKEKIDLRLDIVQHLVENNELRTICYDDYLRKVPDLLRIAHKISTEKCNITDLMKVYNASKSIQKLYKTFQQVLNISNIEVSENVTKLFQWSNTACSELEEFRNLLEESIDVDSVNENGEYMVKSNSDEDIARISLELQSLCSKAKTQLTYTADDINLEADKTVKLEIDTDKGFALKVTKNNEPAVRNNRHYEQLSLVKKDGYRFTNKALTQLSNKYVTAKQEYDVLAKRVIEDVISKAVMFENEVLEFAMSITVLDVFISLATSARQNNYIRPLLLDSDVEKIDIDKLRHPCIENQPDVENYVPSNVTISKDEKKFYLITGPNMGGKSTFIKSVAVGVLMAQCGSLIPAEDARISVVDGIFTRIGAGDRQMDGISTFMEEMMDISTILQKANKFSLVIIDELGRGTSTFDGFGLAWSISQHLATNIKCYTLFATHLHELTEMEQEIATVGNLHVRAYCQDDKLTMLYDVCPGACDESYGINVARYTKFPDHVIESAKEKLRQFEEVPGFKSKQQVREFVKDCVRDLMTRATASNSQAMDTN